MATTAPLIPANAADRARWAHTGLRRRILYDTHEEDLKAKTRKQVGNKRFLAWGEEVDMSSNVGQTVYTQKAVQYDQRPDISVVDGEGVALIGEDGLLDKSGLWLKMPRVQRDTLGLRVMFVRVDIVDGELAYREVFPDSVTVETYADRPGVPVVLREARLYPDPDGGDSEEWLWDVFDLTDKDTPVFRVEDSGGENVSEKYLGTDKNPAGDFSGADYPFRFKDGDTPFIPYAVYRAVDAGMWDAWQEAAVFSGTMQAAVFQTQFAHLMRTSSWPQRWSLGLHVAGVEEDENGNHGVPTDPAMLVQFEQDDDFEGQPSVGQFKPAANPAEFQSAIANYERRVASMADLNPADIQRMSGDPRSGFAMLVSREGQRSAQRKHEENFRRGDKSLLAMSAAMLNQETGTNFPESGYQLVYRALPRSPEELMQQSTYLNTEVETGHLDRVTAHMRRFPGMTEGQARADLERIRKINLEFRPN